MAEELEEAGPQAGGVETDPAAMALALGGASRAKADAFLDDQRGLIADQRHHMRIQLRQLHLGIAEKWLGVLLRVATAFTGLAVAAGLAYLIWNAANSNDLVIDAFQVPPDLAVQGFSGQVVAAKLSDKIAAMQAQTTSQRAPKSYANGLADGLKLDIPETGVSLSELDRFLREKLGHDLHIGGEMVEAGKDIALTARVGTDGTPTVTGAAADIDAMLQKVAEQVYRTTQPYRFAVWLQAHDRVEEGVAILKSLAASGPPGERAWAYNGWAIATTQRQGERAGLVLLRRGAALDPNNYLLAANIGAAQNRLGREEDSGHYAKAALDAVTAHGKDYTMPDRIEALTRSYRGSILAHQGALREAVEQQRLAVAAFNTPAAAFSILAVSLAQLHEPSAAGATMAETPPAANVANSGTYAMAAFTARMAIALETQDWPAVLAAERDFAPFVAQLPGFTEDRPTLIDPPVALALAHMGDFAAAEARLKAVPDDCYPCLRARAQVAALEGQNGRGDWWFARAAAISPTSPFAEAEWGRALLDRRQPDAAIEKFAAANKLGPHFADPLESWGEALMAQNRSDLALAKFAAAEKYAPNWGRLHLKWGEALTYSGKPADARAQFARAAALDLTAAEKAELARQK